MLLYEIWCMCTLVKLSPKQDNGYLHLPRSFRAFCNLALPYPHQVSLCPKGSHWSTFCLYMSVFIFSSLYNRIIKYTLLLVCEIESETTLTECNYLRFIHVVACASLFFLVAKVVLFRYRYTTMVLLYRWTCDCFQFGAITKSC